MPIRRRYKFDKVEGVQVGRFNGGLTSTFIIYRIGGTLIDSGPSNQWRAVQSFVSEALVHELLLTHHHEDHSGNAGRIAKQYNLIPYAPELSRPKLAAGFKIPPMQKLIWGSAVPVETRPLPETMRLSNGMKLTAVHIPGHAKDLHCFYLPDEGWIFTADLFIARRLKYLRVDENLNQMIESLRKVITLDFDVIFCAHRGILEEGKRPLLEKLNNLLEFCQQVQTLHNSGVEREQIVKQLLGSEGMMAKLTRYNFSKHNLVSEALKVPLA